MGSGRTREVPALARRSLPHFAFNDPAAEEPPPCSLPPELLPQHGRCSRAAQGKREPHRGAKRRPRTRVIPTHPGPYRPLSAHQQPGGGLALPPGEPGLGPPARTPQKNALCSRTSQVKAPGAEPRSGAAGRGDARPDPSRLPAPAPRSRGAPALRSLPAQSAAAAPFSAARPRFGGAEFPWALLRGPATPPSPGARGLSALPLLGTGWR